MTAVGGTSQRYPINSTYFLYDDLICLQSCSSSSITIYLRFCSFPLQVISRFRCTQCTLLEDSMDADNDAEPQHEGFEQASTYKNDADVPIPTSSAASDISIYSSVLVIREPLSLGRRQFGIRLVNFSVAHRLKKIRLGEPQVIKVTNSD